MTRLRRVGTAAIAALVTLWQAGIAGAAAPAAAPARAAGRIVAIGDIHGELDGFRGILEAAGLIDPAGRWVGGQSTLVQLGDFLDRGPAVRAVMDLLMRLQEEARAQGGEVVVLLGNHEQMNLLTLYRDVSPAALEAFVDDGSEDRRRRAYEEWAAWEARHPESRDGDPEADEDPGRGEAALPGSAEHRERWLAEHPPGWLEYHAALGPDGPYGRWLRERPVAAIRGGVLFLHAGLSPGYAQRTVDEINRLHAEAFEGFDRVRRYLVAREIAPVAATYPELRRSLVAPVAGPEAPTGLPPSVLATMARDFEGARWTLEEDSPLWFRGYARWPDAELRALLDDTTATHGIARVVAGHSPLESASIHFRLDGRVFLVDTGMLTGFYGGRASALEVAGGRLTAIYPDERKVLVEDRPTPPPRRFRTPDGEVWDLEREEEVLAILRFGRLVEAKSLALGVTGALRLVLERDGRRLRAVFHDIDVDQRGPVRIGGKTTMYFVDSYRSQIAAYELSRLMGLDRVPPTAERVVEGERGSAQLWIEDGITWGGIRAEGREVPDLTFLRRQMDDMRVFDNLIHNTDRNQGNILFDADWTLWWIDNTRSFSRHRVLVAPELVKRCSRELWRSLRALDPTEAVAGLHPPLSRFEIDALLARRDRLVALLEARIAELGEEKVLFDFDDPPEAAVIVIDDDAVPER